MELCDLVPTLAATILSRGAGKSTGSKGRMKVGAVIFKEESLCFGSLILPNIGALIVRIGSWVYYTIIIIRNHQNSIGNYQGPFFTFIPPFRPRVGKTQNAAD